MRKSIAFAAAGVVLGVSAIASAGPAFASESKLTVDGVSTTVHSFNANVARVLIDQGVSLNEHDTVSPSLESPAASADIVVRHGRLLNITVDGKATQVWSTALTVNEAVAALNLPGTLNVSVPGDTAIGLEGLSFSVTTEVPPAAPKTTRSVARTVLPADTTPATGNTCGASYYDEGQMTASGEVFDPWGLTAAHKTLPLGSMVKVTNVATGLSVIVRINDRGPYVGGRCLDLSAGAFSAIGSLSSGTMTVNWELVS